MKNPSVHPVLRHGALLLVLLLAASTVIASGLTNLHSAPWLLAFYIAGATLIAALRRARASALFASFAFYLTNLLGYLMTVWILHVCVPGNDPNTALATAQRWDYCFMYFVILVSTAHLHFTIRFAGFRSRFLFVLEWFSWAVCSYYVCLQALNRFTEDYRWSGHTWVPALTGTYMSFFYFTTFSLTAGILVPFAGMLVSSDSRHRLRLFFYVLGAAPVWLTCWGNFLISAGINIYPAGGVMFMLHAVIIAYAVFQRRAFDVVFVVRRGLIYALCSLLLGLLFGFLLLLVWNFAPRWGGGTPAMLIFLSITGFLIGPLFGFLQRRVDLFFFRVAINRERILAQFLRETTSALDLERVAGGLCGALNESLGPRRISFYLNTREGIAVLYGMYDKGFALQRWPEGDRLPEALRALADKPLPSPIQTPQRANESVLRIETGDEALLVPIFNQQEKLGCLILEPKVADEPYAEDETRFAETLAGQSSIALLNARNYAELQRVQAVTARILQSLSAGVLLVAHNGRIAHANQSAQSICGTSGNVPANVEELAAIQPSLVQSIHRTIAEQTEANNDELTLAGAEPRTVLFSLRSLSGESAAGKQSRRDDEIYLVILHDITDYKLLKAAKDQREHLARLGEAVSTINHEIKNLLQPVRYQLTRLMEADLRDTESLRRMLNRARDIIPERLSALDRLLINLKDIARPIELRPRQIDLADLIAATWRDLNESPSPRVGFHTAIPDEARYCSADGHWMRHVIYNLMRNAVEATSGKSSPRIEIKTCTGNGLLRIQIQDNGCGIGEDGQKKLFTPFYSTKGQSGTGLGLIISRKIVELHGGAIICESSPNAGSTFTVELPHTLSKP